MGKGSNCIFDDSGFDGVVLVNQIDFIEIDRTEIYVGAGFSFTKLGILTARDNLSGLEFASGIPGTVGGAVYMNAGALGQETKDCLTAVGFVDEFGKLHEVPAGEIEFAYRTSSFQKLRGAIVYAKFNLTRDVQAEARQKEMLQKRYATQPYGKKTCGSVFRNPENDSAARLIEACGLKGKEVGGVKVSNVHANFIENFNQGTYNDILTLIDLIETQVYEEFNVRLKLEAEIVGENGKAL